MRHVIFATASAIAIIAAGGAAKAAFVANFHENLNSGNNNLFVFGASGTNGTITGNDGFVSNFVIDGTGVYTEALGPRGREMTENGVVNNLSLFVDSNNPISGIALNRGPASTDQTILLDTDGLGNSYRVLTTGGRFGSGSQMSVTAVEDNTTVTITSPLALAGNAANTPFNVSLNRGESVFFESEIADSDLSGTRVVSNNNVAVFAGAECTQVPLGVTACDHIISQQFSTDNFDTEFKISENFGGGADSDLVRVIADEDNTEVFFNGVSQGTINAGQVLTLDNIGNGELTATNPVMVGQFIRGQSGTRTLGDPAFALIPSDDQWLDSYGFATPVGQDAFTQNFLNIAIAQADAGSLMLNGVLVDTSGFVLVDGFLYGNIAVDVGIGTIEAANPFLATISGFSSFDSYFSPIATAFSPGVSPPPVDPPVEPPQPPVPGIPLPASALLLGSGVLAMGALRRRRRKA